MKTKKITKEDRSEARKIIREIRASVAILQQNLSIRGFANTRMRESVDDIAITVEQYLEE